MAALNLEEGVSKKDLEVQAESSADVQVLSIANNFLSTYYQAFATDRGQLLPLYVSKCVFGLVMIFLESRV